MANIIRLNALLGIMIMVLLDHYISFFHKLLPILINLIKIKLQCLLWLKIFKILPQNMEKVMKSNENRL